MNNLEVSKTCVVCLLDATQVVIPTGKNQCNGCIVAIKKKRLLALRDKGLCRCGKPLVPNRTMCAEHLADGTARTKKFQRANAAQGLCPCGKERDGNRKNCRECLDASWERALPKKRELKRRACEHFGNKCHDCNGTFDYPEVFDFHHLDKTLKSEAVSKLITKGSSWEVILAELLKCVMLCSNCHRIRHAKEFA